MLPSLDDKCKGSVWLRLGQSSTAMPVCPSVNCMPEHDKAPTPEATLVPCGSWRGRRARCFLYCC